MKKNAHEIVYINICIRQCKSEQYNNCQIFHKKEREIFSKIYVKKMVVKQLLIIQRIVFFINECAIAFFLTCKKLKPNQVHVFFLFTIERKIFSI